MFTMISFRYRYTIPMTTEAMSQPIPALTGKPRKLWQILSRILHKSKSHSASPGDQSMTSGAVRKTLPDVSNSPDFMTMARDAVPSPRRSSSSRRASSSRRTSSSSRRTSSSSRDNPPISLGPNGQRNCEQQALIRSADCSDIVWFSLCYHQYLLARFHRR